MAKNHGDILLVVQKSQGQPPGMYKTCRKQWNKLPYQLVIAGFFNHQQKDSTLSPWTCSSIDHFRLICRHGLDSWQPNACRFP